MEIRQAIEKDLSRIAEIYVFNNRINYWPIFKDDGFSFGELQVVPLANDYFGKKEILEQLMVFDDGLVKGFVQIKEREIKKLYVDPFFQSEGIGAKLIEEMITNHQADYLWALEKNTRAISFYQKHGFLLTDEKVFEEGTSEYLIKLVLISNSIKEISNEVLKLRLMTSKDYQQVYDLWIACKGMGLNNLDDSKEGIEKFLQRNPETCFVAKIRGKIVGVIIVGNDGRRGYIYHTAVHPDFRKQKIASRLVEEAIHALDKIGIHKVALVVFERNAEGNLFWKKQGFIVRKDLTYRNKTITEMVRIDT